MKRHGDTRPESLLKRALLDLSVDFVCYPQWLHGRPDFAMPSVGLAVFVEVCWWTGCTSHWRPFDEKSLYWESKLRQHQARIDSVTSTLERMGWTVVRVVDHDLLSPRQARFEAHTIKAKMMCMAERDRSETWWWMPGRERAQMALGL